MKRKAFNRAFLAITIVLFSVARAAAALQDDSYVAGYAGAVLEREFKVDRRALQVKEGVVTLAPEGLKGVDQTAVVAALSNIQGVVRVEVRGGKPPAPLPEPKRLPTGALPAGHLFKPLLADPRWPHFSAAYHYFIDDFGVRGISPNFGTVSFGETIPFYRGNLFGASQWEVGLQAGVFSDFDLSAPSTDLINADYFAGAFASYRTGNLSAMFRLFHQSSHLGDELILRTRLERLNLSYEGADLRLSYEFPFGIRLYGGGNGLFRRDPSELDPWSAQYGIEYRSPWRIAFAAMRPIAAADFKNFEENDWSPDFSLRAGVQFENVQALGRNLQILLEYFNGNSPSGQFLTERVEYIGLGAHFHC